jgi:hypothetical protein
MSNWALILWAAVCFGSSFAVAHFAERLLLSIVGWTGQRRQSRRATTADKPEPASSNERASTVVGGEKTVPTDLETPRSAPQKELKDHADLERLQIRVRHPRTVVPRRSLRRSAHGPGHSRARPHREGSGDI